jgi:DNA gyrase subunit A
MDRARLDHHALENPSSRKSARTAEAIVITEIPYQVNKATMIEKIAEAGARKADRGHLRHRATNPTAIGVRVVIELKRDATPDVVLNQLWRHTPLQSSSRQHARAQRRQAGADEPQSTSSTRSSEFREEVITRRTKFELNKARERAHILVGLVIAVANLDEVVRIIRTSPSPAEAREKLMARELAGRDRALYPLIDDPSHRDRGRHLSLSERRSAPSSTCASTASPRWAATRSATSCNSLPPRSPNISRSLPTGRSSTP